MMTSLHSCLTTGAHTSFGTCSVTVRQTWIVAHHDDDDDKKNDDDAIDGDDDATYLLRSCLTLLLGDLLALLPLHLLALVLLVRHLQHDDVDDDDHHPHLRINALGVGDRPALGGEHLLGHLHLLLPCHQLALLQQKTLIGIFKYYQILKQLKD